MTNQFQAIVEIANNSAKEVVNNLAQLVFAAIKDQITSHIKLTIKEVMDDERDVIFNEVDSRIEAFAESRELERSIQSFVEDQVGDVERQIEDRIENALGDLADEPAFEESVKEILRNSLSISVD